MTNLEAINTIDSPDKIAANTEDKVPGIYLFLKIVEYLILAAFFGAVILFVVFEGDQKIGIYAAALISLFIFILLTNRQLWLNYQKSTLQSNVAKKAELYNAMYALETDEISSSASLKSARKKALQYCQELIEDYKKTRKNSRNIYYVSQIATIILSGVTPILVLVERLDTGESWFKWLPVIFPALASIVASIVTSFPFQENWIAANATVELLEAEQEKFVLGVTPAYRCYDIADATQRQKMAKKAIENFINQVNSIHLKQIQEMGTEKSENQTTLENQAAMTSKTFNSSVS